MFKATLYIFDLFWHFLQRDSVLFCWALILLMSSMGLSEKSPLKETLQLGHLPGSTPVEVVAPWRKLDPMVILSCGGKT